MSKKVNNTLKYIIFILCFFCFITNVKAYTKEDILNIFNNIETCSGETVAMLNGVKASYTRMLNERNVSNDNLNKIYANISEVVKLLHDNNLCSVEQKNKMNSSVKTKLYNLYIKTNDIILSSPKLSGEKETDSKVVIDSTNKQLEIYENGVLSDVIELEEKLNYVGLNKLVILALIIMPILLLLTIGVKLLKKERTITTCIIYVLVMILSCTFLFRNKISIVLDTISLMSVNSSGSQKQLVVHNEKIISYPSYGDKYAEMIIDGQKEDIFFGDSPSILKKGIGQASSSYLPGENSKTILSGHNTGLFGKLIDIKEKDKVTIETVYGEFIYQIESSEIVSDTTTSVLKKEHDLIMYTCYPKSSLYGDKRIVVYAKLIESNWIGDNHEK